MSPGQSGNNGAARLADKLGALSVGGTTKSDSTTTGSAVEHEKCCSSCGKTGDGLKKCAACKCVYYCSVACQKDHRSDHKRDCKPIKKILESRGSGYVERAEPLDRLSKDEIPLTEDCPICMLPLPSDRKLRERMICCGNSICGGCTHENVWVHMLASRDSKMNNCVFCRAPPLDDDEDTLNAWKKRTEGNDAFALAILGTLYMNGSSILSLDRFAIDRAKGLELLERAADLGSDFACFHLGVLFESGKHGVIRDRAKAKFYLERAAQKGDAHAQLKIGILEKDDSNYRQAMRHWQIGAAAGDWKSAANLICCFGLGKLRHIDLANSLQAKDKICLDMKSEQRSRYEKYLGEYGVRGALKDDSQYWLERFEAERAKRTS